MSENKGSFGETSWNVDTSSGGFKKDPNKKDQFLRLDQGSNVVRVLCKPHEYLSHRFKPHAKDPGFGDSVRSSKFYGSDILEEPPYNLKAKKRWYVYVIDRKTQALKLLDISKSVLDGIKELFKDDDWGDPTQYDIDIKVNKQVQGAVGYYTIIPKSKKPLSPADLELKSQIDLEDLKRRCQPATIEQMKARVAAIIAKSPNFGKKDDSEVAAKVASDNVEASQSNSSDEDDSFDFPAVNG